MMNSSKTKKDPLHKSFPHHVNCNYNVVKPLEIGGAWGGKNSALCGRKDFALRQKQNHFEKGNDLASRIGGSIIRRAAQVEESLLSHRGTVRGSCCGAGGVLNQPTPNTGLPVLPRGGPAPA